MKRILIFWESLPAWLKFSIKVIVIFSVVFLVYSLDYNPS